MKGSIVRIYAMMLWCTVVLIFWSFDALAYPQRMISLAPSITKNLYLLGIEERLIANTDYCIEPPAARNKEKVGGVMDVNLEKIISLAPDLVLATTLADTKRIDRLKDLGIEVVVFPPAEGFDQLCNQLLELGKIVGSEREAEKIVYQAKKKVFSLRQRVKRLPRSKVLVQVGSRPLWVATKRSFVHDLIEFAGGVNIGPSGRSGLYSLERVLENNPDVIIITTMGITGEEEKEMWKRYGTLNAVKNDRIYIIDSYKLCSPTPKSFVKTLEEIIKILHPEIVPGGD